MKDAEKVTKIVHIDDLKISSVSKGKWEDVEPVRRDYCASRK
jgi:hypothetical protein